MKKLAALLQVTGAQAANAAARELLRSEENFRELVVEQVAFDSRFVKQGTLFVAIKGFEADGHNYLAQAQAAGATAAIVEYVPESYLQDLAALPLFQVAKSRIALAEAAACFYDYPSESLSLVGITASNGKTSTSLMYRQIVKSADQACGLIGTVSYEAGEHNEMSHLTTPDACKLQELLSTMRAAAYRHAVMECSSIGIDQARNYACKYRAVAFNNVSREHLDYHGSFAAYVGAKTKLLTEAATADTAVILNFDDPLIYERRRFAKGPLYAYGDWNLWVSRMQEAAVTPAVPDCPPSANDIKGEHECLQVPNIFAKAIDLAKGFAEFELYLTEQFPLEQYRGRSVKVRLQVPGYHSVMNALSAMALALATGFSLEDVVRGIEAYRGIERRFQRVFGAESVICRQDAPTQGSEREIESASTAESVGASLQGVEDALAAITIYDDHFANPGNIAFSLKSLTQMTYRNLYLVYALRGKRGAIVNRENIEVLAEYLPELKLAEFVATCSQDVVGRYDEVQADELQAFRAAMDEIRQDYRLFATLQEAVDYTLTKVAAGDLILLAGCQGMDAGARLCLTAIGNLRPKWDRERLLAAVADRICGQEDEAANKDKLFAGNQN